MTTTIANVWLEQEEEDLKRHINRMTKRNCGNLFTHITCLLSYVSLCVFVGVFVFAVAAREPKATSQSLSQADAAANMKKSAFVCPQPYAAVCCGAARKYKRSRSNVTIAKHQIRVRDRVVTLGR